MIGHPGFIDAMRWGAVTSADPDRYRAPFWSGVTVEAYQLEPLRRALTSPRTNLLLADDVGLVLRPSKLRPGGAGNCSCGIVPAQQ